MASRLPLLCSEILYFLLLNIINYDILYVIIVFRTFVHLIISLLTAVSLVYQSNHEIEMDVLTLLFQRMRNSHIIIFPIVVSFVACFFTM